MIVTLAPLLATTLALAPQETGFEVLVLGTGHAPTMFLSETYTPAHIRATLEKAAPDIVAVESHPTWFAHGRYHVVTYEAEGVAVPWARQHEIPAVGVDWKDITAWDRTEELGALDEALWVRRYSHADRTLPPVVFGVTPNARFDAAGAMAEYDWERINSREYGESRHAGLAKDDPEFAAHRDREIAKNCVANMADRPGERLVVVIGAHHKPFLDELLSRVEGVRVLQPGIDVPWPTPEEVEAAWTEPHLVVTLGWLLDGRLTYGKDLPDEVLARAERLLDLCDERQVDEDVTDYLRARWHAKCDRPDESAALLDGLIEADVDGDLYPFPMRWWRMRYSLAEAARVERARILLAEVGDEEAARARAEELLAMVATRAGFRLDLLTRTTPRESRTIDVVKDPGFELGRKAPDFFDGWASYIPTGHGRLTWNAGAALEGERSLHVTIDEANPRGYGFVIRQECRTPSVRAGEKLTFALSMKAEGMTRTSLRVLPSFSARVRTPLATAAFSETEDGWSLAAVTFTVPQRGDFAITIDFDGPDGAQLWLDGGTPITADYMTLPHEWSRAKLAAEFPRTLLESSFEALTPEPAPTPASSPGRLQDAGFEARGRAPSPAVGWHHGDGVLELAPDPEMKFEGERSLRVTVKDTETSVGGRPAISQVVQGAAGAQTFTLQVRADAPAELSISVGTWNEDHVFEELGHESVRIGPKGWTVGKVRVDVPRGSGPLGLFAYLPAEVGRTVWFDDARLEPRD